jgi:hypothetical protein
MNSLTLLRLVEMSALFSVALCAPTAAQLTTTPGPGGIPIAPGAPLGGYTPGGVGLGGVEIAPGRAARGVPVYRKGPGGVRMLVNPRWNRKKARR